MSRNTAYRYVGRGTQFTFNRDPRRIMTLSVASLLHYHPDEPLEGNLSAGDDSPRVYIIAEVEPHWVPENEEHVGAGR